MSTCDIAILALSPVERDTLAIGVISVVLMLAALVGSPGLWPSRRGAAARPMPPRHARATGRRPVRALCASLDAEVEWGARLSPLPARPDE